ncbi:MAG: hypothetical protein GX046_01065 [Tissierellia bacterium]|nr:hypothetical protein [Tissierellia bacterium]
MANINIKELAKTNGGIYVSMYLPTHRNAPENKQDRIRFKNLINQAEKELQDNFALKNPLTFLKEAEKLYQDVMFWTHASDGLALLISEDNTRILKLEGHIPERLVVGSRFHLLPLLNYYEFMNESYILDIAKDRFKLYYGGQEGIIEVETAEIDQSFNELFDDRDIQSDNHHSMRSSKSELNELETEKYLRYVAKGLGKFMRGESMPLLVFGTTEVVSDFKEYSKGELDIYRFFDKPLGSLNLNEIYQKLKEILLPRYEREIESYLSVLNDEIARDRGTDNESLVLREAPSGRIESLFIASDMGGLIEEEADKLIQNVITTDGKVILIDESITPFPMGVGAIFRY